MKLSCWNFLLLIVALIVGGLIGTVGVGGILLIPALSAFGGLTTHAAMATSLFSFIFTGILGTWLYCKHGSINWGITIPVCIGGLIGGYPGALANAIAPAWILNLILGCIIIFAGIYALFPAKGGTITYRPGDGRQRLQLHQIITPSGKIFEITQDDDGKITDIILPDGGTIHNEFDDQDNLISVTDPEGGVRRYEYDDANHMTAWYDENDSMFIRNTYDSEGRVTEQEDALGNVSTYSYERNLTIMKDNRGNYIYSINV